MKVYLLLLPDWFGGAEIGWKTCSTSLQVPHVESSVSELEYADPDQYKVLVQHDCHQWITKKYEFAKT